MQLVVVRHGRAGAKHRWDGDDRLRPLDSRGRRQARAIATLVAPMSPWTIRSSPLLRCTQTVAPLAEQLGLSVLEDGALAPDAGPKAVSLLRAVAREGADRVSRADREGADRVDRVSRAARVGRAAPACAVLCTHGEVLSAVLPVLAADRPRLLRHKLPGSKGCAWVLEMDGRELRGVRYIAPG